MINFKRIDNTVTAEIDTGRGWSYDLRWTAAGGKDHAMFVRDAMQHNLNDKLKEIREAAYNQGWADAKSKKRKSTWFSQWF